LGERGRVVHSEANGTGTSKSWNWEPDEDDGAVLHAKFASRQGQEGDFSLGYRLKDDSTMVLAVELLGTKSNVNLIRAETE
jgi:hypothetical protein